MISQFPALLVGSMLVLSLPCPAVAQSVSSFPLRVEAVTTVGEEAVLGSALAGRVGPNGNVYIVDHVNAQIVAFSPEGRLLWKRGRKGRGPGEFQLPYRLDVRPDGAILVFDLPTSEITTLSASGRYLSRARLPFRFHQLDNLVSLSDDEFVAAGVLDVNTPSNRHGIHRFRFASSGVEHRGSFGPLPAVRDPAVLQYWGAGSISRASGTSVLFARRLPYEVYRYDRAGRQTLVLRPPFELRSMPDDFIRIERTGNRFSVSTTDSKEQLPGSLAELANGWVIVSRVSNGPDFWDIYSPSGQYSGSRPIPEEWGGIIGYDPARSALWMTGTQDDEPVLFRLRVSGGGGTQPMTRRRP